MICEKHPKYKGITKLGKRNASCPACNQIFKVVQEEKAAKIKQERVYNSLTTPDFKCDLAHLLGEVITIMKFGLQSERFWQETSSTPKEIKQSFFVSLAFAKRWINTKGFAATSLKAFFYMAFVQEELKKEVPLIQVKEIQEDEKPARAPIDLDGSIFAKEEVKKPKNVFSFLNEE